MNKKQMTCLMSLAIMVVSLSACGQQTSSPAAAITSTSSSNYTSNTTSDFTSDTTSDFTQTPDATASVEPTPAPPVDVANPSASASPTPSTLPSFMPTPSPVMGDAIVQNVVTSTPGILMWEKSKISFQLRNPSWLRTLRERLVVTFTLKGVVVEVVETQIQLSGAKITSYTFESTKHADGASAVTYSN